MASERHIDQERMAAFMQRLIADLGATVAAGGVVVGDRLGLYRALAADRMRPQELARRTGTAPRYVEEWLRAQAAGGYIEYDQTTGEYFLSPEQAHALADADSDVDAPAAFQLALGALKAETSVTRAFRTGEGIARSEHDGDVSAGYDRFTGAWYRANLVPTWLPALDGVVEKLRRGARVADIGWGCGSATTIMAQAFPASHVTRWDCCHLAVEDGPYDLVTTLDVLHDLGDPFGAARQIREQLAPDGTWMIVEPIAGTSVTANLNPVGRMYYALSTFLCVPNALAQEGGYSLGAQAGQTPVRRLVLTAGFGRFRRVAQDLLHAVYEARP
jgi:hypothetical protein